MKQALIGFKIQIVSSLRIIGVLNIKKNHMKMITKKIYYLAIAFTLAISISSCSDWLDIPSTTSYDSENVFTSVGRADLATLGTYNGLWNLLWNYYPTYGTDEAQSSEGITGSKNCVANYVYSTSNVPTSEFSSAYQCISKANICIKKIPLMSAYSNGTELEKTQLKKMVAECKVIRAVHYLNLIRYWGDVPYITLPQEDYATFYSSRVSRDTIYDGIIADVQSAVKDLPWYSAAGTTNERFTKNSAYGMLARIAMYAAGYSLRWDLTTYDESTCKMAKRSDTKRITELYKIASDACQSIIDHGENSLNPSFESLFRTYSAGTYYPSESLFEYAQYGSTAGTVRAGYSFGIKCDVSSMYGKAEPLSYYLPTLYYAYNFNDTRRDVTCPNYDISSNNTRTMTPLWNRKGMGKWRLNWTTSKSTFGAMYYNINLVLLRYSDVLLMYAEAQNELNNGPTDKAKLAYEQVRLRAFGNDASKIGTTPTSYSDFFKAIVEERKLELAFEGWRRTDLIRWNLLGDKIAETKANLIKLAKRQAPYDKVPEWVAYRTLTATSWQDPNVTLTDIIEVPASGTATYKAPAGYTLLKDYISSSNWQTTGASVTGLSEGGSFIANYARGYEPNKVELLPISQSIIDVNIGLAGQQHPKY
jgi:starch-binding outer membrane protein, SusD/RagB family